MDNQKTVVFLASLGTSILYAKDESYDRIQAELAIASGLPVWQVFTDDSTARAMDGIGGARIYTVEDALETAIIHGFTHVAVVPVFFGEGKLYTGLRQRLDFYRDRIDITMAPPVVHDEASAAEVASLLIAAIKPDPNKEFLFVGYGSNVSYSASYGNLETAIREKGVENVRVLKLSDRDCLGQAVVWLKQREADMRDVQVIIIPLVIAWGDYMADELYNSKDSFMWQLRKSGFRTVFTGRGLGAYEEFRKVYTSRLKQAIPEE